TYSSLPAMLLDACTRHARLPAFEGLGTTMTYAEWERVSRAFAAYLVKQAKFHPGDRIAIMLPNLLAYPVAFLAAVRAGLIVVNVNPLYTPRELKGQLVDSGATAIVIMENFAHKLEQVLGETQIRHVVRSEEHTSELQSHRDLHSFPTRRSSDLKGQLVDSGATAIVIMENFAHKLEQVLGETQIRHVVVARLGDFMPPLKRTVFNLANTYVRKAVPAWRFANFTLLQQACSRAPDADYEDDAPGPTEPALLQYTGRATAGAT